MRRLSMISLGAVLSACAVVAVAEPKTYQLNANMSTNKAGTFYYSPAGGLRGSVSDIYVTCSDNASVATVSVYRVAADTNVADFALATATVTASKVFRPRFDGTDSGGTGLTSDPPDKYVLADPSIKIVVENCTTTGNVWKVTIKAE